MLFTLLVCALAFIAFVFVTVFAVIESLDVIHSPPVKNARSVNSIVYWYIVSLGAIAFAAFCSQEILRNHEWLYGIGGTIETIALFLFITVVSLLWCKTVDRRIFGVDFDKTGGYVDDVSTG